MTCSCCHKSCPGKVKLEGDRVIVIQEHSASCSPYSEQELERHSLRVSTKRQASTNLDVRPAKLLRRCLNDEKYENLLPRDLKWVSLTTAMECCCWLMFVGVYLLYYCVMQVRRSVYRERRKTIPKLPTSSDEALSMMKDREIITKMGEKFNYVSDTGLVFFTCKKNLDLLSKCKTVIIDGTFDRAPDYFAQLYTIHGHYNGYNVPLVYCPLLRKDTDT